ncbi:MAG: maleylpyruvate isomerase family mycothiol-dependent enzyme, partial [Candidatus Rokuibacteriota bacterium]
GTHMRTPTFAERLHVLTDESTRLEEYLKALPPPAWTKPSACSQWQVQDVVAHLVGVAEFYAGTVVRGLQGETSAPPGRAPAGKSTGASAADSIAQRSIAARKSLGDRLLDTFAASGRHLNQTLAGLGAEERDKPCYHPGGIVAAQNFIELRLKELGVHEWDIRAGLEPPARMSPASFPAILATISESIASGSLRWAFWSGPAPATSVRYRFRVSGPGPTKPDLIIDGQTVRMEAAGSGRPQVTFDCDTETYILLVYGRLDLEAALASGRLQVEGDGQLARAFGQWFRGI